MKRFVKEYALYRIEKMKLNSEMQREIVSEKVKKIKKALLDYEYEQITTDEAIKLIMEA